MNAFERHSEQFDQYLSGTMSAEDQKAFEALLQKDEAFASAFKLHILLREGIKESARQDLKQHLREHGKVEYWGGTMWPRSMKFAAAAALLVFASLYVVIRYYIKPETVQNMAVNQPVEVPVLKQADTMPENNLMAQEGALESNTIPPPPPPVQSLEMNNVEYDMQTDNVDDMVAGEMEDIKREDSYTGTPDILTEKLLYDTIYFASALAPVSDGEKDGAVAEKQLYANNVRKKSASRIPATSSNSNQAEAVAKQKTDSSVIKTNTMIKKHTTEVKSRLHVEFWSSPVNFKGYRLVGYDLRLYSVNREQIKLVYVGTRLYMVFEGRVFELPPCNSACNYTPEADTDITSYILEHTK